MKINYLIVFGLIALSFQSDQCSCSQMKRQQDCQNFKPQNCEWDSKTNTCGVSSGVILRTKTQCAQIVYQTDCLAKSYHDSCLDSTQSCDSSKIIYPCAWVDNQCQNFPGCSAFLQTTESVCQLISKNCTSDGIQCINIGECSDYLEEIACQKKNINNKYCAWDQLQGCTNVVTCSQAPQFLNTHELCFNTLSSCTISDTGNGCSYLKQECADYLTQAQCKININQNPCFWDNNTCIEQTCSTAPTRYQSSYDCPTYMDTCIYIVGSGCVEQLSCGRIKNVNDCNDETRAQRCWWNSNLYVCVEWECENAPDEYQTVAQCKSFKEECSPALDGYGCTKNTGCTGITTQTSCTTSPDGSECYWNTDNSLCLKKTCDKAPSSFSTYEQCNNFLPTCTLTRAKSGCEIKVCSNAPDSMQTNEDCERYLPNNNCITMSGGGCRVNGECASINAQVACVKDINNAECYWVEETSDCITKECDKAPAKFINSCETFLAKCQQNQSKTNCEDKICTNYETADQCTTDYKGQACRWQGVCIERTCENASKLIKSYDECQNHLPDCTLSNSGSGCMQLPLLCSSIKTKDGCQKRKAILLDGSITTKKCDWINGSCIDRTCDTASKSEQIRTYSNLTCNDYLQGCYINNEQQGCMVLPNCTKRGLQVTCEIVGSIDCIWSFEQNKCMPKSCATANVKQSQGSLTSFSQSSCLTYQLNQATCQTKDGTGCCTLSNDGQGCMDKPDNCTGLTNQNNCILKATKTDGDCYWKGTTCVTFSCSVLVLPTYSHQNCFINSNNKCTVYKDMSKCDSTKNDCSDYTIEDQCTQDNYGNDCVWTLTNDNKTWNCEQAGCDDIIASNFLTHRDCQDKKETCTVIPVVGDGCIPRKARCFDYKFQIQCQRSANSKTDNCVWNGTKCWDVSALLCADIKLANYSDCEKIKTTCKANSGNTACENKVCTDFTTISGIAGTAALSTYEHCQALSTNCSINAAGNACVTIKQKCSDYDLASCKYITGKGKCTAGTSVCYTSDLDCVNFTGINDGECQAYRSFCGYPVDQNNVPLTGSQKCINRKCTYFTQAIVGSPITHDICQNISLTCTASYSKASCISISQYCYENKNNKEACVMNSKNEICKYVDESNSCTTITRDSCNLIDNPKSFNDCNNISTSCTINRSQNACVNIETSCQLYSMDNCFKSSKGYCVYNNQQCQSASSLDCNLIDLGTSVSYTDLCSQINPKCTNLSNSACQTKTCTNASVGGYSHTTCNDWLADCTVNSTSSGCVTMKPNCADQTTKAECLTSQLEGPCTFDTVSNLCIKKTCYNSVGKQYCDKDKYPLDYMDSCTVAQPGGCQTRVACRSYISQLQCLINNQNGFCFWNPTYQQCVDYSCENIEKTSKFDTHDKCADLLEATDLATKQYTRCTVYFDSTGKAGGCMSFKSCFEYKHEEQCYESYDGIRCNWNNKNADAPFCENRTCDTAPKTITTDQDCKNYELTVNTGYSELCTVDITEQVPGVYTLGGCRSLTSCDEYKRFEQCLFDQDLKPCKWYNEQCYDYTCESAPSTIIQVNDCESFKSDCTISVKGQGCMIKDPLCETFQKSQCIKNINGDECFWDTTQNKCLQITCSNQPTDSNYQCSSLPNCMDSTGHQCISKSCQDFLYKTHKECQTAPNMNGICTTDGTRCITNTECELALVKEACQVNYAGKACVWVSATATNDAYCKTSLCELASSTIKTEGQCQIVSETCTLKKTGGCKEKTTCSSIEVEGSCVKSIDNYDCKWNTNKCDDYVCKNFKASDHFSCKGFKSSCTVSSSGTCTEQQTTCDKYTIQAACVETVTGETCQWIPTGKCVKYKSCSSLPLVKDSDCKSISKYCTSDTTSCIPLKQCKDTANVSCFTGSDGNCMLYFTSEDASSKTCQSFGQCESIKLLTHKDCQTANSKCTSDGQNGCISLQSVCSAYSSSIACVINSVGYITVNGQITSTGKCVYANGSCRDESCQDFGSGTTHSFCNQKLISCTSDGTNCIQMQSCASYTIQASCVKGKGSDGICYWTQPTQTTGNYCKLQTCTDVTVPSTDNCSAISNCIYDGSHCIIKTSCEKYTTQIACQQGSSSGQVCFWANLQCNAATNCTSVASDSAACAQDKNCIYTTDTCVDKTCENVYASTNQCSFYTTRNSIMNYCVLNNGTCSTATNLNNLPEDQCLVNSNYTRVFQNGTCQLCNKPNIIVEPVPNCTNTTTICQDSLYLGTNFLLLALFAY